MHFLEMKNAPLSKKMYLCTLKRRRDGRVVEGARLESV